jgi:hypothetical protein
VWGKCEKPKSGKNMKNSRGNFLEKNVEKVGVEKTWINDLVVNCEFYNSKPNYETC